MGESYKRDFAEYEVKNTSIKFSEDEIAEKMGCVGTFEETLNEKKITKKCEGVIKKTVTRGDGTGELKLSLHMRYDLFVKSYGMVVDGYKDGVYSYGQKSIHKPFILTAEVLDEDGNKKFKAYPNCVISGGIARKIENGAEEVAEIEVTITIGPDDEGQGLYEALESQLTDETIKEKWLTNFSTELLKVIKA